MLNWRSTFVSPDATIREAVEALDQSQLQVVLVVDKDESLKGLVVDGDVRRGMLRGFTLKDSVVSIMNEKPVTARTGLSADEYQMLMARNRIRRVPVLDESGRLVGLEIAREVFDVPIRPNTVFLMAGGLGTRLRPLTNDRPKPLLEIGGMPILEKILRKCAEYGFSRFVISVNYMGDMIEEYFGSGSQWGVEIEYVREKERLGTAGALSLLDHPAEHPMLVMNGDLLTDLDLGALLDFHQSEEAAATMCVREYDFTVPYGVVVAEGNNLIDIQEKPVHSFFVNAGVYVLDPSVAEMVPQRRYDMTDLFRDLMEKEGVTKVFPVREAWLDIGRPEDYERANASANQGDGPLRN